MMCPKCGSEMSAQIVVEGKRLGFWRFLLYLFLLCLPFIGWITLFYLIVRGRRERTVVYMICGSCGNTLKAPKFKIRG